MEPARASEPDSATYARDLLNYAAGKRTRTTVETFAMPRFRLELATDSDGYAALCQRALVNSAIYSGNEQRALQIGVFDRIRHPDLPKLRLPPVTEPPIFVADVIGKSGLAGEYDQKYQIWQFLDPASGNGIEALSAPKHFAPWTESFPLRNFLHWAFQSIGWRLVHAGTLGTEGKGVMLVGPGGAGKSGTTLSGILGGLDSVGDDYIALDAAGGMPVAYPLMKLMKQDGKGLTRLGVDPDAIGADGPNWQNKYEFDFERLGRGRRAQSLELQAIIMPRVARAARSTFTRAPSRAAMLAFAPSNLQQLPGGGWQESMGFMAGVARKLPAYFLDLSEDAAEIAETIGSFIRRGGP